jgi:hypothetical protein
MSLLKAKQIDKQLAGLIRVVGFSASGTSDPVTADITTALSTAGEGGVSVPLQVADTTQIGVVTSSPNNRVEIYDGTTLAKLDDGSGNEVYGRLTQASNVYTLSYYSLVSGVETAYTMSAIDIDFEFAYKFDFARLPYDFAIGIKTRNVGDDPSSGGTPVFREAIAVTGTNTLADLTKTPIGSMELLINGQALSSVDSPAPFTRSGKALTWSASNAGYALATTDKVVAVYESNE